LGEDLTELGFCVHVELALRRRLCRVPAKPRLEALHVKRFTLLLGQEGVYRFMWCTVVLGEMTHPGTDVSPVQPEVTSRGCPENAVHPCTMHLVWGDVVADDDSVVLTVARESTSLAVVQNHAWGHTVALTPRPHDTKWIPVLVMTIQLLCADLEISFHDLRGDPEILAQLVDHTVGGADVPGAVHETLCVTDHGVTAIVAKQRIVPNAIQESLVAIGVDVCVDKAVCPPSLP
jgi:hypothetical protein